MKIYCCTCKGEIEARRTTGKEIYPHRSDLWSLPFWRCDHCRNHVGCHHKTADRYRPLGCIPSPEIKAARQHIHRILDPLWKGKKRGQRRKIYEQISDRLGYEYHTAEIRTIEEARKVYRAIIQIRDSKTKSQEPSITPRTDFSDLNVYDMSVPPWDENQVILERK